MYRKFDRCMVCWPAFVAFSDQVNAVEQVFWRYARLKFFFVYTYICTCGECLSGYVYTYDLHVCDHMMYIHIICRYKKRFP